MPDEKGRPSDNEDVAFKTAARRKPGGQTDPRLYDISYFDPQAAILTCHECGKSEWRVMAAGAGNKYDKRKPYAQLICLTPRCTARSPVFEVHVPQMTWESARKMGLWLPSEHAPEPLEEEFDIPKEALLQ